MGMQPFIENTTDKLNLILEKISSLEERVNEITSKKEIESNDFKTFLNKIEKRDESITQTVNTDKQQLSKLRYNSVEMKFLDTDGNINFNTLDCIGCYHYKTHIDLYNSRFFSGLLLNDGENFISFLNKVQDLKPNTSLPIIFYISDTDRNHVKLYLKKITDISLITKQLQDKIIKDIILL